MAKTYEIKTKITLDAGELKTAETNLKTLGSEARNFGKTAGVANAELDKINKGTAQIGKSGTSNFAKQAQGMGGLVHVYATVAANIFALSSAYLVLKRNSDLSIMMKSANDLSKSTGISYSAVADSMKKITGGAISFTQAMRQANLALSGGATIQQVEEITKIANKAANTLGLSVPEAVGRMIQAVTKGEPELVDELGIILRVTKATEDYAQALGKSVSALTTFEKQQAIINQLITQGNAKFADVEQRTNPFEELSASLSDLSNKLISFVAGPVSSLVKVFSGSEALMGSGIALLLSSIAKKAVPEIAKIGENWRENAAKGTEAAQLELVAYNQAAKKAADITEKLHAEQDKQQLGPSLSKDLMGSMLTGDNKIDARSRISQLMKKSLSKGLVGKAFMDDLKSSGFEKELNRLLTIDANPDKMGVSKTTKKILKQHSDEMQLLAKQIKGNTKQIEEASAASTKADKAAATALSASYKAQAKASFTTGVSSIFSTEKITDVVKNTKAAMSDLNASYGLAIQNQTGYNATLLKGELYLKKVSMAAAGVGRTLAFASKAIPWITGIIFAFQSTKALLESFGILSAKFAKQAEDIKKIGIQIEEAKDKYKDINEELKKSPDNIQEVVNKWSKAANVVKQYSAAITDSFEAMENASDQSFLNKILNGNIGVKGAKNIIASIKEIEEITNKPFEAKLLVAEDLEKANELRKTIKGLKKDIEGDDSVIDFAKVMNFSGVVQARESGKQKRQAKIKELSTELSFLDVTFKKIDSSISTSEFVKLLTGEYAESAKKSIINYMISGSKEINEYEAAAKSAKGALLGIDRISSSIAKKSIANRIFNSDTLTSYRSELVKLKDAMVVLQTGNAEKGNKAAVDASNSAIQVFKDMSKSAREAFFPGVNEDASVEVIAKGVTAALEKMDKQLDVIRNYASVMKGLTETEKQIRIVRDKNAGSVSAQVALYSIGTQKLVEEEKNLKAEIESTIQAMKEAPKDKEINTSRLTALLIELGTVRQVKEERDEGFGVLKAENALLARAGALTSANLDSQKQKLSLTKEVAGFTETNIASLKGQTTLLDKQQELAMSVYTAELEKIRLAKEEIMLKTANLALAGKIEDMQAQGAKLNAIEHNADILKLANLKEQLAIEEKKTEAKNLDRGQIGSSGLANSFAGFFSPAFWESTGNKFGVIADEMALKIGNSVEQMATIVVGGIEAVNSTLVDALMSNEWDGKEEGRSMGRAIEEALKDSLRQTIGQAIKDNMTQAVVKMGQGLLGSDTTREGQLQREIAAMSGVVLALQSNTTALYASASSSSASSLASMGGLLSSGGTTTPGLANSGGTNYNNRFNGVSLALAKPGVIPKYARGTVTNGPELALIGEGKNNEAVVPLPDNRSIPVKLEGSDAPNINMNQNFDFRGADASTEAKLRQYAAVIKKETIKEMMENINRGGSAAKMVGRR